MAAHFTYPHLPASGLGTRDPRRPYVTGGVGSGVPTFVTIILEPYHDPARRLDRDGYADPRSPTFGIRYSPTFGGNRVPVAGTLRSPSTVTRSTDPVYRTPAPEIVRILGEDPLENYAEYSEEIEDPNGA